MKHCAQAVGSGYPLQVLGLLHPKGFGWSRPVGFTLLSLPGKNVPELGLWLMEIKGDRNGNYL
jgi:hypothetical protein